MCLHNVLLIYIFPLVMMHLNQTKVPKDLSSHFFFFFLTKQHKVVYYFRMCD